MALAIPVVLAAGGYAAGAAVGYATLGMYVGWMIGSWLINKGKSASGTFSAASDMPQFNNALRGLVIPHLFGTNRVSSNIVWQHNFTSVRKETSGGGGGKGGGSGGSKGGGGSSTTYYDYYWDLVYHIGMVPDDSTYNIFGAWLGSTVVDDNSILQLTNITGNYDYINLAGGSIVPPSQDAATLDFTEGVFSGGGNDVEVWPLLQSATGADIRWPYTFWVGFSQLYLGQSATIPQITFEVGPGKQEIISNSEFIGVYPNTDGRTGGSFHNSRVADQYGQTYWNNNGEIWVMNNLGQQVGVITVASVKAFLDAGPGATHLDYPGDPYSWDTGNDPSGLTAFALPYFDETAPGAYIVITTSQLWQLGTNEIRQWFIYAEPVDGDVPTFIERPGFVEGVGQEFPGRFGWYSAQLIDQDATKNIILRGSRGLTDGDSCFMVLPNPKEFGINPNPPGSPSGIKWRDYETSAVTLDFPSTVQTFFAYQQGTDAANNMRQGDFFILPRLLIDGGIAIDYLIYMWIGKPVIEFNSGTVTGNKNQYIHDNYVDTYPDGLMISFPLYQTFDISDHNPVYTLPEPTVRNYLFNRYMPPADEYVDVNGDTGNSGDVYFSMPYVEKIQLFGYAVVMFKIFNDSTSSNSYEKMYCKGLLFAYDGVQTAAERDALEPQFTYRGHEVTEIYLGSDIGWSAPILNSPDECDWQIYRDKETSNLYIHSWLGPAAGAPDANYRYVAKFGSLEIRGGDDVYPPYIIKTILTSPIAGLKYSVGDIDDATYQAALNYCQDNGYKVSTVWTSAQPALDVIDLCLSVYGGFLKEFGGKVYFGILEYTQTPVRTLDNDHFLIDDLGQDPVKITKAALQDTFNKVRVNYIDRSLGYYKNQAEEGDEVDQDLTGTRMKEFPAQFVMSEATARKMAVRGLYANLYGRDIYELKLGWKDSDLEPGDVVTIVDSVSSINAVARITRRVESKLGVYDLTLQQEVQYIMDASATALNITSASVANPWGAKPEPWYQTAYELPQEFSTDNSARIYAGWMANGFAQGATLYLSTDDVTYAAAQTVQPYAVAGRLITDLPNDNSFVENVEVIIMPTKAWSSTSASFSDTLTLNEVGETQRSVGASLLMCGSEALAYEGVNLVSQNRYRFDRVYRGWGGTNIHAHSSGDFFHRQGTGIFSYTFNEDKIGTTLYYKVAPFNVQGVEYDVASITAGVYTIQGTFFRPQNPPNLRAIVGSEDLRGDTKRLVAASADISIDWRDSARVSGYGTGGFGIGAGGYGRFTTDANSHNWRVEIVGSGDVVVRSLAVDTAHYTYPGSQNAADNGDWRGNIAVKVTTFNPYGDSIRTSVTSLELFA